MNNIDDINEAAENYADITDSFDMDLKTALSSGFANGILSDVARQYYFDIFKAEQKQSLIVGEDMICPITKEHCDDECCPIGAVCNLSAEGLSDITPQKQLSNE